ncbi:MAG: SulP family inorganic anion transporter, partial [Nitrospinaceae bacterium]|nr:SulP family inorganic anion transporter [Nitrospinaceae bacterium]
IPSFLTNMNPKVGVIGITGIIIVLGYGYIKNPKLKIIPAPMLMLLITVPMGTVMAIGLEGSYTFNNQIYELGQKFLVNVPGNLLKAVTFPDFSGVVTETGIKYTVLFAIIGGLEGVISAKAIDGIDPWGRKTNLDRDLLATGIANTMSAFIGGLPMISEIVRSKANIDNGARTRFANFYHGLFLLFCVALIPGFINQIPLAALAALLVITGYRLASPNEFKSVYREGKDQFIVFVSTIFGVLATDLLKGLAIGIGVRIVIHFIRGGSIFRLNAKIIPERDQSVTIFLRGSIINSSWIPLQKHLNRFFKEGTRVTLDITETKLMDRRVMAKVDEWAKKFKENGLELTVRARMTSIDE